MRNTLRAMLYGKARLYVEELILVEPIKLLALVQSILVDHMNLLHVQAGKLG
jgi:hypothetical protein